MRLNLDAPLQQTPPKSNQFPGGTVEWKLIEGWCIYLFLSHLWCDCNSKKQLRQSKEFGVRGDVLAWQVGWHFFRVSAHTVLIRRRRRGDKFFVFLCCEKWQEYTMACGSPIKEEVWESVVASEGHCVCLGCQVLDEDKGKFRGGVSLKSVTDSLSHFLWRQGAYS